MFLSKLRIFVLIISYMRRIYFLVFLFSILFSCKSKQEAPSGLPNEGFINVPGGSVWYRISGADKPGIPLLLVHGGPGAPHDYLDTLATLGMNRPVVFYDQLGCGNSDKPSDTSLWNIARFVEELDQVRTALNLQKVHIMGQSWGAMLAVEYILRKNPQGVISLTLSGPLLSSPRWIADQQAWLLECPQSVQDTISKYEALGVFTSQSYQDAMTYYYNLHLCRLNPWPACLNRAFEKMGKEVYAYMWGPSEFTCTGTLKNADLTGRLGQLHIPTLFTCGQYDEAPYQTINYFQSLVPGSEICVFPDASHSHHLEQPVLFVSVLSAFLQKNE